MAGNAKTHGKGWPYKKPRTTAVYLQRTRKYPRPVNRNGESKDIGKYEAHSVKPSGAKYVTFHHTRERAEKRLAGNHRHRDHHIVDRNVPVG